MTPVDVSVPNGRVQGSCHADFEDVLTEFVLNFETRGEVGASVCLNVDNESIVDLWGGLAQTEQEAPWQRDSVSVVFSSTKGATALCAHVLAARGQLDLNAHVTDYWPEYGANGKADTTVAMMLNHSAGVPAFREPLKKGAYYDWDYMVERLSGEAPFWTPGTRNGYHMMTFGWTVGELVRRVSGRSLGTFFQEEIAGPLGLDFWIGLPEACEGRVSPMLPFVPNGEFTRSDFVVALMTQPESITALSLLNNGGHTLMRPDSREAYAAELGGGGGIANARGLAGMYAPLANGGGALVSPDDVVRMGQVSVATQQDATLLIPTRFSLGFMKSMDNRHRPTGHVETAIMGDRAFGHVGAGGSIGFADPDCNLGFGYSMNQMGEGLLLNPRGQALADAAYRCLGYTTNAPGVWTRG